MARTAAVNPGAVLPAPTKQYDETNERETRRLIEAALRRLVDFNSMTSVPANLGVIAGLDPITAFAETLLAAADEAAGRTALGIGALAQRADVTLTTGSIADSGTETGSIAITATSTALLVIAADRSCRVRLYTTSTARDADAARVVTTKGTPGTGLLAEFVFAAASTIPVSPVAILANDESPTQMRVFYNVENTSGAASAVAVTLTVLPLEI
jgi:hypothetical protein